MGLVTWDFLRRWRWLLFIAAVKIFIFLFLVNGARKIYPPDKMIRGIFAWAGDVDGYYLPAESFFQGKGYLFPVRDSAGNVHQELYTFRTPGIVPLYCTLRLFFSREDALVSILFLQLLADIMATYLLALCAEMLLKRPSAFPITAFLYGVSANSSMMNHLGYMDAFHVFFIICALFFILSGLSPDKGRKGEWHLLPAGLFLIWSAFLRTAAFVLYPAFALLLTYRAFRAGISLRKTALLNFLFALPAALCIFAWCAYNLQRTGKFQFVDAGKYLHYRSAATSATRLLIISMGERLEDFSNYTFGDWFYDNQEEALGRLDDLPYTKTFNRDSLILLRQHYQKAIARPDSAMAYQALVARLANQYRNSIREERPFYYYFYSKVKLLKKFLFPTKFNGLTLPPKERMNIFEYGFKGFNFALFLFINFSAICGILLAVWKRDAPFLLFALLPLSLLAVFAFILGWIEWRYYMPVFPLMIICAAYLFVRLKKQT